MIGRRIAQNTIIQVVGKGLSTALGLVSILILTRYLGAEGYGQYTTIIAVLSFFVVLADMGLYQIMTREISKSKLEDRNIVGNIFTVRLVFVVGAMLIALVAVLFFPYSDLILAGVAVGAVGFVAASLSQVMVGIYQKNLRTDLLALAEVVGRLVWVALLLFLVWKQAGILSILAALVIGNLISFLLTYKYARGFINFRLGFDIKLWRTIIRETLPYAATVVLSLIYFKVDTIMLSLLRSPGDVGIYGVGYRIMEILIVFPGLFIGLMLPLFTFHWAHREIRRVRYLFQRSIEVLMILAIPLAAGVLLLSRQIVDFVAGEEFIAATQVVQILIIATIIIFFGNLMGNMIVALNKQRQIVWAFALAALLNVLLNLIVIPHYSYIGAAVVTVATEIFIMAIATVLVLRTISFFPSFTIVPKIVLASLMMSLVVYFLAQSAHVVLVAITGMVVYGGALWLLRGVPRDIFQVVFNWRT